MATAEEKEQEIIDKKIEVEGLPMTDKEEFAILAGRGIEYKAAGGVIFVIPNVKVKDYYRMIEYEEKQKQAKNGAELLDLQMAFIAQFTTASKEQLIENLDKQDCDRIMALMFYSWLEGKAVFKKKAVSYAEVWEKILRLRGIAGGLSDAG